MRRLLVLVVLVAAAGCFAHRPLDAPGIPAPEDFPSRVRVVRTDGTFQDLVLARIEGDTVRGEAWDRHAFEIPARYWPRLT